MVSLWYCIYYFCLGCNFSPSSILLSLSLSHRSTNLNELAKAVRLLAALDVEGMTPDDLLRAARALANATAGLLNASSPEHLEVREHYSITCSTILV